MSRSRCRRLRLWALVALAALAGCGGRPLLPDSQSTGGGTAAPLVADFTETFAPGQLGAWLLEQDEHGSTAIVNEQLVITLAAPNTIQYATLDGRTFGDFALEVDATQRAGPAESSYGILFRIVDGQQFYRFDITGNGLYMIERHNNDGTWTRLVPDWTPTSAIVQGLNQTNRLRVLAVGSSLTFYVNGILLTTISDATYTSGAIALDAGTFGGANMQVSFDNLAITTANP